MKKLTRLLYIAAAVVAALAVALIVLWKNPPGGEQEDLVLSGRAATDIASVHVENANGSFDVTAQDGGYLITDVPVDLVDLDTFIGFMTSCANVTALQKVDGASATDAAFGLAEPQATVQAAYTDGASLQLSVGNAEPVSGGYYVSAEGRDGVYLLSAGTAENYLLRKESFVSFYVTPKLAVSSALSALQDVTFSGGTFAAPVTIESVSAGDAEVKQLARSFGAATHIVRGAGVYELDQTYGLTVLEPLCGLMAQAIVGYGYTAEQEDAMGFSQPYMQVAFGYQNGGETPQQYVLRLLPAAEDGSLFYANIAGSGVVYVIKHEAFLDVSYEKLLLRWFLSPLLMDVSGVTVSWGGRTAEFTVDNADAKNPVVAMNGQPLDTALFRSFFQLLGTAANDGAYLGVQEAAVGTPVMTVTYHYAGGKADDVMELYPGDTRRVRVYVNGACEFAMKDAFVTRVQEAVAAMERGESFDINW